MRVVADIGEVHFRGGMLERCNDPAFLVQCAVRGAGTEVVPLANIVDLVAGCQVQQDIALPAARLGSRRIGDAG
ncbi:hypothetical protein [Nocardia cyriacigeorgica]|uniref:hypothetical protein n=1 Tax=Nocardia cyriacigeorgica TaxID=135487 RepID=UPI0018953F62|nr:hypothetical protein [Nocardia cyriacigeorgica]MBF6479588.1 hypothetical protein [Nocardia cyriacigeorgica]